MEVTSIFKLNKPEKDDNVLVKDLNENTDSLELLLRDLYGKLDIKANVDSPTFTGMVLAPKYGTENNMEILEQVITIGTLIDALTVENLDKQTIIS